MPLSRHAAGIAAEAGAALPSLSPTVEIQLVRIVQEALANVRKHAHAHRVQIRIHTEAERLTVVVQDDGVGFEPGVRGPAQALHFGLATMRERATVVGGQVEIESAPGRGTRVIVHVPVDVDDVRRYSARRG